MAYFRDLTPCHYFGPGTDKLLAIGWLDSAHDYHHGPVEAEFVSALCKLLANPWQPAVFTGAHPCPFCRLTTSGWHFVYDGTTIHLGVNNVFVPEEGRVFVAPSLILHYIDAHRYAPPPEFVRAVKACPQMRSISYLKAMRANRGTALIILPVCNNSANSN